jgi:hypothetical protein
MENINKSRVSLAGEFAVLSQLALRGKDANMTLGNTKGVDILVSDPETSRMLKLEVKTNYSKRIEIVKSKLFGNYLSSWILDEKNEKYDDKKDANLFYCFVNISQTTKQFKFYIVPAKIVAEYLTNENRFWHSEKNKEAKKVKTVTMRNFRIGLKSEKYKIETPTAEKYEDNWDFNI